MLGTVSTVSNVGERDGSGYESNLESVDNGNRNSEDGRSSQDDCEGYGHRTLIVVCVMNMFVWRVKVMMNVADWKVKVRAIAV